MFTYTAKSGVTVTSCVPIARDESLVVRLLSYYVHQLTVALRG